MKLPLLLFLIFITFINNVFSQHTNMDALCHETSTLKKFWQCLFPKLPSYHRSLYMDAIGCIHDLYEISDKIQALVFLSCYDSSEEKRVVNCLEERHEFKEPPPELDEEKLYEGVLYCSEETNIFDT